MSEEDLYRFRTRITIMSADEPLKNQSCFQNVGFDSTDLLRRPETFFTSRKLYVPNQQNFQLLDSDAGFNNPLSYLALPACQHAQATLWRSRRDRMDAVAAVTAHLPANQLPCTWINPGCRAEVLQSKDLESSLRGGSSRERNSSGVGRMSQLGRRSCLAQFC
ncbi:hypothetical protein AXG93_2742s1110 [Marchantia polymorpha subsp. ruderalis]|uniref:Uncharacterized protein n=1 Tax=Marchantia polymorpha subsp. ruderalis TaxID=1480154 RepID=A0A176VGN1_MARPO|nr:hypothetical protein AXG93_2742s1110 [Marchantia polymorpha subsp. ruderalis]